MVQRGTSYKKEKFTVAFNYSFNAQVTLQLPKLSLRKSFFLLDTSFFSSSYGPQINSSFVPFEATHSILMNKSETQCHTNAVAFWFDKQFTGASSITVLLLTERQSYRQWK